MAVPDYKGNNTPQTQETEQYVLSKSFDQTYQVLMVGLGAYNPTTNTYDRVQISNDGTLTTTGGSGGGSTGGLTDAQLRASRVPVDIGSATVTISGPVTVSNEVEIKNDTGNPVPTQEQTGLLPKVYDALSYTNTSSTIDTYRYYQGGTSGTLVATLTITYTDTTKAVISTVART